jgi:hypothetical protein
METSPLFEQRVRKRLRLRLASADGKHDAQELGIAQQARSLRE